VCEKTDVRAASLQRFRTLTGDVEAVRFESHYAFSSSWGHHLPSKPDVIDGDMCAQALHNRSDEEHAITKMRKPPRHGASPYQHDCWLQVRQFANKWDGPADARLAKWCDAQPLTGMIRRVSGD